MLFAFADAEPVRFDRDERSAASLVPARAVASVTTPSPGAALPELASATRRTGLPSWVDDVLAESLDGSPLRALASRVREQARGVRRGIWLVAGGVGAALIVALLVVPESESSSAGPADPVPSETPYVVGDPLITGDDPLAAWASLAAQRERCIRDLSVLCLDGVDQAGSAALAEDVETVRALQAGAEMAVDDRVGDPQRAELIERLGDSALVRTMPESASGDEKTQPASVLLMKGEAGWRIRSWLPGG